MLHFLYASKPGKPRKLVATFDSEPQLRAYVSWATLQKLPDGTSKFEQGSVLAGNSSWEHAGKPLTDDNPEDVEHNPSPTML